MKLKTNSRSANYYVYFYGESLPTNLCPYFWKLLFAYAVLLPSIPFLWPLFLVELIKSKKLTLTEESFGENSLATSVFFGFAIQLLLFFLVGFVAGIVHMVKGDFNGEDSWYIIGFRVILGILAIVIVFIIIEGIRDLREHLVDKYYDNKFHKSARESKKPKEPKKWILIEFIKAKYKKYCPKIEWS